MPIPKRWFAVSREIGDDPDVWELTDTFGDRALRAWLEVLAMLDRTENRWKLSGKWLAGLSRRTRQKPATVQRQIDWMIAKRWLVAAEQTPNDSPLTLMSPNYFKYHKKREPEPAALDPGQGPPKDPETVPSDTTLSDTTRHGGRGDTRGEVIKVQTSAERSRGSVSTNEKNSGHGPAHIAGGERILEKWPHLMETS